MFSVPSSFPEELLLTAWTTPAHLTAHLNPKSKELGYYGLGLCEETRNQQTVRRSEAVIPASPRTCPYMYAELKKHRIPPWPLINAPISQSSR
ncbi:hypothetical protein L211DRAFT_838213 [Terfezia boudieri ATCC MYA-4762]|uniref:Uncharacterized protein n=1 Tax=Terfezia boudieri ATCC MYA-4762 TaxID=1051890 RepID=A0A3N4LQH5_9PEZI|nr:hypothetical protein L211DRAFT_838213 [Terfezia boudieri ATCC MYA-4762]